MLLDEGGRAHVGLAFLSENVWIEAWDPGTADLTESQLAALEKVKADKEAMASSAAPAPTTAAPRMEV